MTITDTANADTLQGNETDETIVIVADNADDSFDGASGVDTVDVSQLDTSGLPFDATFTADLQQGFVETPNSGRDALTNVENVVGSGIRDVITGNDGPNVIQAGGAGGGRTFGANSVITPSLLEVVNAGDEIRDGAGADDIQAQGGDNVIRLAPDGTPEARISADSQDDSYLDLEQATSAVVVNMGNQGTDQTVLSGGGFGDQSGNELTGLSGVAGTDFADQLAAERLILDGAEADSVSLTEATSFVYLAPDGVSENQLSGSGSSTLNFVFATSGVTVNLPAQGTAAPVIAGGGVGSQAGTSVSGFTKIEGSAFGDSLVGDDAANTFNPSAGKDTVAGGGGDDQIDIGQGADVVNGGAGADTFSFRFDPEASAGVDTIADFDGTENDTLELDFVTAEVTGEVSFAGGVTPHDPATPDDTLFTNAAGGDVTNGVVVQDDGLALTSVFVDINGSGGFEPDTDAAFRLTGTIASTSLDAEAFGLSAANQPPSGNTPPSVTDDTASTTAGDTVTVDVLANDGDADGDTLTLQSVSGGENGTVTTKDGEARYAPDDGFAGTDSFTYTVADGNGATASGQVTVSVTDDNKAPVTNADTAEVTAGSTAQIDVLANDSDPDGDSLVVANVGTTPDGTTSIPDPGRVQFTPNSGFTGTTTFSYAAADQNGGQTTGQVTVDVQSADAGRTLNFSFTTASDGIEKSGSATGETFLHLGDTPTVIAETGEGTPHDLNGLSSTQPSTIESQSLLSSFTQQDALRVSYPDGTEPQNITAGNTGALQNGPQQSFETRFVTPDGVPSAAGLVLIENSGDTAWDYVVGFAGGADGLPTDPGVGDFTSDVTNSGGTNPIQTIRLADTPTAQPVQPAPPVDTAPDVLEPDPAARALVGTAEETAAEVFAGA